MPSFYMIEFYPDMQALFRMIQHQGLFRTALAEDPGYAVHIWLGTAFGQNAPKPFRVMDKKGKPARVLAYSRQDAKRLREYMAEFSTPFAHEVCPDQDMVSKPMPQNWRAKRVLRFETLCCPVVRKNSREKDAFLAALDRPDSNERQPKRPAVYLAWLEKQMAPAAKLLEARLDGFRLQPLLRRGRGRGSSRAYHTIIRPTCLFSGSLGIEEPELFQKLLIRGLGRHRAFGFGMLLLRP